MRDVEGVGMRLAAVDPGVTSGWAYVDLEESDVDVLRARGTTVWLQQWGGARRVRAGQVEDKDEVANAEKLMQAIGSDEVSMLAVESFELRPRRMLKGRGALSSPRVGAVLRLHFGQRYVEQQASAAKGVITDDRLREWGLWVVGQEHARDAVRHLVLLLRRVTATETQ